MSTAENDPANNPKHQELLAYLMAQWLLLGGEGVPIIKLDLDSSRADELRIKHAQYRERMLRMRQMGNVAGLADTKFKHDMLSQLLESGELNLLTVFSQLETAYSSELEGSDEDLTWSLAQSIAVEYPDKGELSWDDYADKMVEVAASAFCVLQDYVVTGGATVAGGQGLLRLSG